jgi:hypothetical protein
MRGLALIPLALLAILLGVVYIFSIFWAYDDAESRGKPGCLVAILVALLSWPLGLVLWIVFRPEHRRR